MSWRAHLLLKVGVFNLWNSLKKPKLEDTDMPVHSASLVQISAIIFRILNALL